MATILVLEDNPDLGLMIRQILEWKGHHVLFGRSGLEGLDLLKSDPAMPDLILCDLMMPEMDGYEFLDHMRVHETWGQIPFIVMSAHGAPEDRDYAEQKGANGFLAKPFGLQDIDIILTQCNL